MLQGDRRKLRSISRFVALALAATALGTAAARAQDATWLLNPTAAGPVLGTFDFDAGANWNPATVPTGTATFGATNGPNLSFSANTTIGGWTFNAGASNYVFQLSQALTFDGAGIVINGGSASISNSGTLSFDNSSTAGSATITNNFGDTITFNDTSTAGSANITNNGGAGGPIYFLDSSTAGSATITNSGILDFENNSTAGSAAITNNFDLYFVNTSTAGNATITNSGGELVIFTDTSSAGNATINNNGGFIEFINSSTAGSAIINTDAGAYFTDSSTAGSATINNTSGTIFFEGTSSGGTARLINGAFAGIDLSNLTSAGISVGSIEGAGTIALGSKNLTVGGNDLSTTFSGVIGDGGLFGGVGGSLTKVGTGTLTLSGTDIYTGATVIDGGTLEVDGAIANTSSVTVNAGGTLSGTGTVDPATTTIMSGGTLAPGNAANPTGTLTISGNLAFASGATYQVQVSPAAASSANVTGTASLAGAVNAVFAPGGLMKQYTILRSAGLNGTTFSSLSNTNLPADVTDALSYGADDVFLNLTAALPAAGLNQNQQTIAGALNGFFNSGGTMPSGFASLFDLNGVPLANALSQLDGEDATGAEHGAFDLMNEFLGLMLDPFVDGRGGGAGGNGALGFAPDQANSLPPDIALAYAGLLKAPPQQTLARRWSAWASGFGGSATSNGDPSIGSNNVTTNTYGYAAGMDYHYSPDTVLGFSLAGGGTNWNLANALGTGRSDAFLAGVYGVTHNGPWYLGGALAFANNWFTTNRAAMGDQLNASFQGQSYAARLEGGYRFALPADHNAIGITPYAAILAQNFRTPSYSETDLTGGGFGLSYNAMSGTDTRSELGGRFDDLTALNNMPLVLRAKLAWAHDWVSNPALNASFESLPGTSFTVNGASIPHDSALTSAGAQLFFTPNWSVLAKFDGEFAGGSQLYAGSGTLRYTW